MKSIKLLVESDDIKESRVYTYESDFQLKTFMIETWLFLI